MMVVVKDRNPGIDGQFINEQRARNPTAKERFGLRRPDTRLITYQEAKRDIETGDGH
jgi:hypothetical protein